eukprot:1033079-Amorphochlora_amoeboformis.AAC.1
MSKKSTFLGIYPCVSVGRAWIMPGDSRGRVGRHSKEGRNPKKGWDLETLPKFIHIREIREMPDLPGGKL